CMQHKANPLTF
nr:immunoglobulin light chain junction region [Macaca mulatta]MOY01474.1 immunoglobulin light chain junction region [Macaca mulatta]